MGVLLVLFRPILIKFIGAIWNYSLWFSIFIPWFAIWLPLNFFNSSNLQIKTTIKPFSQTLQGSVANSSASLSMIFLIIWLSGISICLLYIVINHFLFCTKLKINSRLIDVNEKNRIKNLIPHQYLSRIYLSQAIKSPMLCHMGKAKIFLPNNFFKNYSINEQKYVLKHELVHLKRYDLLANAAMLMLICVNWFNPFLFLTFKYFRTAQELACDAVVSHKLSISEKKEYGYALLKTILNQSSQLPAMSCGWNTQQQLKERCQMLKFHYFKPVKSFFGISLFIATACIAIAAPNLKKGELQTINSKVTFSANKIEPSSNNQQTLLEGNVDLLINDKINIVANKVSMEYTENKQHKAEKFIIYGKGILKVNNNKTEFTNGTFDLETLRLTAEKISR